MGARKKTSASSPRSKAARNVPQGQIATNPKAHWWQRTWAKATGIVGLAAALLGAPALINSFVEDSAKLPDTFAHVSSWVRGDEHFAGEWTDDLGSDTEGGLGPPLEGLEMRAKTSTARADQGAVSLRLEVKDGVVTGEITSREIRKNFLYSHLLVSGVVSFRALSIHAWDYVSGTATPIAGLKARWEKVGDEERLEFTSAGWLFPEHFSVWRGSGPKPSFNLDLVKRLSREAEKANSDKAKGAVLTQKSGAASIDPTTPVSPRGGALQ